MHIQEPEESNGPRTNLKLLLGSYVESSPTARTVKKGGRNFHCLDDTIGSSLVLDRLKGPDHHKF